MQIRNVFLAALAALPLFAGVASAHGNWGGGPGYGYDQPRGYDQGRRERRCATGLGGRRRSREWGWQRQRMWEPRRHEPPRGYYQGGGGWGSRW